MEEAPDSGLAEEIQRSQIDFGAFIWGPDACIDSVSQYIIQGRSQEDSACFSELECDTEIANQMLPSSNWPVLGPSSQGRNEELFPKPVPETEYAIAARVDMDQLCGFLGAEIQVLETDGLVKESQDVRKPKEVQQRIEDSLLTNVKKCEKVDTEAIALEDREEFEEEICENSGNKALDYITIANQGWDALKINEEEARKDIRHTCKENIKTSENYIERSGVLVKDMKRVDLADKFNHKNELEDGIQVVINNCAIIESSGTKSASHIDNLNLPLCIYSASNIDDAGLEIKDLLRKDLQKSICDPNQNTKYCSAMGSIDADETQHGALLHDTRGDRDKNESAILSVKHELIAQSKTGLNYFLGTKTNRKEWYFYKAGNSLIEESESTMTENSSHNTYLPRATNTESWGKYTGQIWRPSLDLEMSNICLSEFSGVPIGHPRSASWLHSDNHWSIRHMEVLNNCGEHLGIVEIKGLKVDLLTNVCEEQATARGWEQSQAIARSLVLGTSQNVSTGSSCSPQESDISNSDLSEDEIANQRYGLLYQELEADKEEVLTPDCSVE